jgi:hypothetical protein
MLWEQQEKAAPPGHVYQVSIKAEPERFLDWDKPWAEQSEQAKKAIAGSRLFGGIKDPLEVVGRKAEVRKVMGDWTVVDNASGGGYIRAQSKESAQRIANEIDDRHRDDAFRELLKKPEATSALHEAGIPGIKYLDEGSRFPKNEFGSLTKEEHEVLDHIGWGRAPNVTAIEEKQNPASAWEKNFRHWRELAGDGTDRARILDKLIANKDFVPTTAKGTSNYVVFDDKLIDILKKYGIAGIAGLPAAGAYHFQTHPVDHDPFE